MGAGADTRVELVLERDRVAPGDAVDLVRVESSPAATLEFTVASVPPRSDGIFALTVPEDAPPSVSGRACALVWRVRARIGQQPRVTDPRRTLEVECPS
jgi:hypothetical protein